MIEGSLLISDLQTVVDIYDPVEDMTVTKCLEEETTFNVFGV
jgi:hypothetical protein